jgi:hypothetical protein
MCWPAGSAASVAGTSRYDRGRRGRPWNEELGFPCSDVARTIHACAQVDQRRRSLWIPAMLVASRPLHAHRTPHGLGEQRRVACRIFMAVAAVAIGTCHAPRGRRYQPSAAPVTATGTYRCIILLTLRARFLAFTSFSLLALNKPKYARVLKRSLSRRAIRSQPEHLLGREGSEAR